jgi:hypothetical protein
VELLQVCPWLSEVCHGVTIIRDFGLHGTLA